MSEEAVGLEIGARIKKLRLNANIPQEQVCIATGISRQTLVNMETHGKGTLATLIAFLRAIGELERLSSLLEDVRPSPIKVVEMSGKLRKRATNRGAGGTARTSALATDRQKRQEADW